MFDWLRRRKAFRNRQIFRYWDGLQLRWCDPIETLVKLQSHPQYDYQIHPQMVDDGDFEAIQITCEAVRQAFDARPFDSADCTGLTISETLELLAEFCVYLDGLKKNIVLPLTSPSPTAPISTESAQKTTNDSLDSGSIATEPSFDMQTECALP